MSELSPASPDVPPHDPQARVGDPERRIVIEQLDAALSEGRLELAEYDDRVRQVYAARTAAELAPLGADLPAPLPPPAPEPSAWSSMRPTAMERNWVFFSVFLLGIWAVTSSVSGHPFHFWPIYPIAIVGLILLFLRFRSKGTD